MVVPAVSGWSVIPDPIAFCFKGKQWWSSLYCYALHDPSFWRDTGGRSGIFGVVCGPRSSYFSHIRALVIPQCTCSSFWGPLWSPTCRPSHDRLTRTRTSMACHDLCPMQHTTRLGELRRTYRGGVHLFTNE